MSDLEFEDIAWGCGHAVSTRQTCPMCAKEVRDQRIAELERENDVLRGIASKVMPCHYCGAGEIAKCPHGFPGCALADDIFVAEESYSAEIKRLREAIEAHRAAGDVWQREAHPYDRKLWSVLDGLPPADSRSGGAQRSAEEG